MQIKSILSNSLLPASLLIALLLLISGCVSVQSNEIFYPNGRSTVVSQIYISNLLLTLEGSGISAPGNFSAGGGWNAYLDSMCSTLSSRHPGYMCHRSGNWLIIDENRISGNDFDLSTYDQFPYTIYDATIYRPPLPPLDGFEAVGSVSVPQTVNFLNFNQSVLSQIHASGLKYNYFVMMPGDIYEYSTGKLFGNSSSLVLNKGLAVDAIDWANSRQPLRVKSRELNVPQISAVLFIGMFLFLVFDVVVIWTLGEIAKRSRNVRLKKIAKRAEETKERLLGKDPNANPREVYKAPKTE